MISKDFFGSVADHLERLEVAFRQCLRGLGVLLEEAGRAADGVHHHRVVERRGDDPTGLRVGADAREVGLVGHRGIQSALAGDERVGGRLRLEVDDLHVLHAQAVPRSIQARVKYGAVPGADGSDASCP
jgi:hypothetical protein